MTRTWRITALVLGLVLLAGGAWLATRKWGPPPERIPNPQEKLQRLQIESVSLVPIPEGPSIPSFSLHPGDKYDHPLSEIAGYIPEPLPSPLVQPTDCKFGGDLVIKLVDKSKITYGPCSRPDSINHLWAGLIDMLSHGSCEPKCGPGGMPGP